ncbi:YggS family pyridoxal phosphate-dependent enzyme [Geminocystis herdmanii]|uniref:YggS family pyridoxal phosphate-dependent enzyme n=1 Tax=Geminocystis herdmanii TaxID=669359 RepID=UPI00034B7E2B|nr:YggS family pyridoxal phosphate-dependent enzyme [Geminocystis herdmanii]
MNDNLVHRLREIQTTIPSHVRLIAVSKTVPLEAMVMVYGEGIRDFAENKLQDAIAKQEQLKDFSDICWHFIGHLQTNKAKKAIECFSWIHSVDSLKLAQKLDTYSQQALDEKVITDLPQICLQVKILPDENKHGWSISQLYEDLETLKSFKYLNIRGLMTILPLGLSSDEILSAFAQARDLLENIKDSFNSNFDQLSMGMSGDYLLAIEAGATMVRLGTIIFGDRKPY